MTCRFRSSVSAASAASTWGIKVAWWKRGAWPSAMATAPWIPRTPIWGLGREMRVWRGGGRAVGGAAASLWAAEPNRLATGIADPNGMTVKPQWACRVWIIGVPFRCSGCSAVGGGDRGGDQGDVAPVQANQDLPQVHADGGGAEARRE